MGVLPPRLLQGHSPFGEPQCMALVENRTGSGEGLVKDHKIQRFTPQVPPPQKPVLFAFIDSLTAKQICLDSTGDRGVSRSN